MKLKLKIKDEKTTRDATYNEIMAWHILQLVNICELNTCCTDCIGNNDDMAPCICDQEIWNYSYNLLNNKKIILELIN